MATSLQEPKENVPAFAFAVGLKPSSEKTHCVEAATMVINMSNSGGLLLGQMICKEGHACIAGVQLNEQLCLGLTR